MPFRAQRVRIQIPCGGSGSILNPDALATIGAGCDAGCSDSPQSAVCPPVPPLTHLQAQCGVASGVFGIINPWDEVINPAERVVLSPEDLPLFKEALELKLKALMLAENVTTLAKTRVQGKLEDIAQVEQELHKAAGD